MSDDARMEEVYCHCEEPDPRKDWSGIYFCFKCGMIVVPEK